MTLRLGEQRPVRMRRIGERHMIVMPPQVAKVMSVDDIEQALRVAEQQERQTQGQLDRHRAYMADLRQQLAAFKALPIERDEADPDVPQPDLVAAAAERRDPTLRGRTAGGGTVHGLVRGEPCDPPLQPRVVPVVNLPLLTDS